MAEPIELEPVVRSVARALADAASRYEPKVLVSEVGQVTRAADGVLQIRGLRAAANEELLEVDPNATALALGMNREFIEAICLHGAHDVRVSATARRTSRSLTIPTGEALLGRVVDPLGRPVDGAPLRGALVPAPLEAPAPRFYQRAAVHQPLYTGCLSVDAMFPIGRGQRQLVVGEEGTGKTALVVDAVLRQASTDVVSVYVAIGRRRSETWQIVELFRKSAGRWVLVTAPEDDSPGLRYLAPYAGTAIAEYFSSRGEHALVIYDDLTAHAVAWRELSLLLRRPPGREAYPGDVFYLHSRLLERAAQLSDELGGGSLTALPVAVLESGRLTAYIPTNLISITDGQVVLSRALFAAGQKPAIDAGLSVSRVGGKAQPQALRELAGRLRLDYAAFLELEAFSRLGTRLEAATEQRIATGRRIRALLLAPRLHPLGLFDEVVRLVLASSQRSLLTIPEAALASFAVELTQSVRRIEPAVARRIERDALLQSADRAAVEALVEAQVAAYSTGSP